MPNGDVRRSELDVVPPYSGDKDALALALDLILSLVQENERLRAALSLVE